jgi:hypothetical protein
MKTMNIFVQVFLLVAAVVLITPTRAQQYPICYLCGDGGASNVTRPNTTIPLPEFLGFGDSVSCKEIQFAGETLRLIPPGLCTLIDSRAIHVACGCKNALTDAPTTVPVAPVKSPTPNNKNVVQMIRGMGTNAPSPTPSASPTASPVVKGAKQSKNGKNPVAKSDSVNLDLSESEKAALAQLLRGILTIVNFLQGATSDEDSSSEVPSNSPSSIPSFVPSEVPSAIPSSVPSTSPSDVPTTFPSGAPSAAPSTVPSSVPSSAPSFLPSSTPSELPSTVPSSVPSDLLSESPSDVPSNLLIAPDEISFWEQLIARINELLHG